MNVRTYPRILPVNIHAVEVIVDNKVRNISSHSQTIRRRDTIPKDHIGTRIRRERPPPDRQDARRALDLLEKPKLIHAALVRQLHRVRHVEDPEAEVDVRVCGHVELRDVLVQTGTNKVVPFVKADATVDRWRGAQYNINPAVGDAAVGPWGSGSRGAGARGGAEVRGGAALR